MPDSCAVILAVLDHLCRFPGKARAAGARHDINNVLFRDTGKKPIPFSFKNLRIFSFSGIIVVIRQSPLCDFDEGVTLYILSLSVGLSYFCCILPAFSDLLI